MADAPPAGAAASSPAAVVSDRSLPVILDDCPPPFYRTFTSSCRRVHIWPLQLVGRPEGAGHGLVSASAARTGGATGPSDTLYVVSGRRDATIYCRYRHRVAPSRRALIAHGGGRTGQCLGPSQGRPGSPAPARFDEASTASAELGSGDARSGRGRAYERSAEASAEWNLALVEALRTHLDASLPLPLSWPETSLAPRQLALPLGDEQPLPSPGRPPGPRASRGRTRWSGSPSASSANDSLT